MDLSLLLLSFYWLLLRRRSFLGFFNLRGLGCESGLYLSQLMVYVFHDISFFRGVFIDYGDNLGLSERV